MRNISDLINTITITYSNYPKELNDVVIKAFEFNKSICSLINKYKQDDLLPLSEFDSDLENLNRVMRLLEEEVRNFGRPCEINKGDVSYSEDETKDVLMTKEELMDTDINAWLEKDMLKPFLRRIK